MAQKSDYESNGIWKLAESKLEELPYGREYVEKIVAIETIENFIDDNFKRYQKDGDVDIPKLEMELDISWRTEEIPVEDMEDRSVCEGTLQVNEMEE